MASAASAVRGRKNVNPWAAPNEKPKQRVDQYRPKRGLGRALARLMPFWGMKNDRAFYVIVAGAIHADGLATSEELSELTALRHRARTLRDIKSSRYESIRRDTLAAFKRGDLKKLVLRACWNLPSKQTESVFLHACDIVAADRFVAREEIDYLAMIARALNISDERAEVLARHMQNKNEY